MHLKQNHLLLRYIKQNYSNFTDGWTSETVCGRKNNQDYINYAKACGLDSEITTGQSFLQKQYNLQTRLVDMQKVMNNQFESIEKIDPVLKEKLIIKDKTATNFINGWQSLQNDRTLVDYMIRHGLLSDTSQPIERYNALWSEKYVLEDQ